MKDKRSDHRAVRLPRGFITFISAACPEQLQEEIEGDLLQRYRQDFASEGEKRARRKLFWNAIGFLRPGIFMRRKISHNTPYTNMIFNYIKSSWRNLTSSKFYSTLNIVGLTIGLAVGLLIVMWVTDELSFDRFHHNAAQLYRTNVELQSSGQSFRVQVTPPPVATVGLQEVPGIQNACRINDNNDYVVYRYKNTSLTGTISIYTDGSFFKMFDFPFLAGDVNNPFPQVQSVIITQSAARRFFGDEDPMGKTLLGDNKDGFVVTGVMKDFPGNSFLKCDLVFPIDLVKKQYVANGRRPFDNDWGAYAWVTFFQLEPGVSPALIAKKLTAINVQRQPNLKPADAGTFFLQPLTDVHLYDPEGREAGMKNVRIFAIVAVLILIIASINYVNLSTARALLRSKEVSVRKVIGAGRGQLFAQFIVQTILFFIIALVFAVLLIVLVTPMYNLLAGKHMQPDFLSPSLWATVGCTLLLTLLASSVYPALLLSSFKPIEALRGAIAMGAGNKLFRKILVVVQFSFSTGLIVCTLIIARQLHFIRKMNPGFDKSYVVALTMNDIQQHYTAVKASLLQHPSVQGVTSGTGNPVSIPGATLDISWEGKNPDAGFFIHTMGVDHDFMSFFKIPLVTGKDFTGAISDTAHFILNETAVREMGLKDPIGKAVRYSGINGTVIGVVKDFHFASAHRKIEPFLFYYRDANPKMFVRTTGQDAQAALDTIEKIWSQYNEGLPFDYSFLDEKYNLQYAAEERTGLLFNLFAAVAIVISCLGLFGLATYTAQVRVKEIGIRKVLGASVASITKMLSVDFIFLVIIAVAVALPVSGYLMGQWLNEFFYRTPMAWWVFGLSGAAAIVIALFTVSFQCIRAALDNPVKSLKNE